MKNKITIAFASGKGGTGKTSLAVNFAQHLSSKNNVKLFDLDVEEPNTGIFFSLSETDKRSTETKVSTMSSPVIDKDACTRCGICADKCNYNALALLTQGIMHFKEMCKGCGRCAYICPNNAISLEQRKIGTISNYSNMKLQISEGLLDTGEIHTKDLIKDVKAENERHINIYDCPPGTTCPMVEAVKDADYILLVTEPTPFGLHDLTLAIEVAQKLNKAFAIIINKAGSNDIIIEEYCAKNGYTIITKIPFSRELAQRVGSGQLYYKDDFFQISAQKIESLIIEACR